LAESLSIFSLNKKPVLYLIFSLILCVSGINTGAEQINIEKLNFELGVKSLKQNNLHEALKYFELVLNKDPNNVEAHYNIAVAHKKLGNHEKSLKHFDKVVELLNKPSKVKTGIMSVADRPGKGEGSQPMERFDVYTEVKEKENDYVDLGDMHADNGQYKAAIEYYNLALEINPYNDNTYFKVCRSYMELNEFLKAEAYIRRAIELDPGNGRYKYYRKKVAAKIDSKYGKDYRQREELVLKNLNNRDALDEFERKNYEKELYEGEWTAGENKEVAAIDRAFKKNSRNRQKAQKNRIENYYQDEDKRKALYNLSNQGFEDFSYKQSQELDYLDLGDLHFDNQEYETAIEYYQMALSVNPNNDYSYYKLARSHIELGEYSKADDYIKRALALSDKNRKYIYFKNRITDKLAQREQPAEDEFYSPPKDITSGDEFYVDEIAREPDEFYPVEKPSFMDRVKSAISSIKMPDFKMPGLSKFPGKIMSPLEGKVEKYAEKREEKQRRYSGRDEETVFNRPSEYYKETVEAPDEDFIQEEINPDMFQEPIKPAEKKQRPYTANYYNQKGIEFFRRDNLEQAEEYFKKAVQLKPMFAKGYNNLANIEVKRGNLEQAKQYALKSVQVDPEFPEGYYNLGLINKKQRNYDFEIHYLNRAIAVDPKYYKAYFARGLAYYNRGNYEKAKYNFSEVLKLKHDHFLASQNLGIIYANELNYAQAEKYLNLAVKLNKKSPQAYFHLGVVRKNSGKLVSAIEDFQKAIELDPANYKSYIMLSKCYDQDSQPQRALAVLRDAAEKNPENAEIYNYLGLLNLKFDKYEDARLAFRKAVEKNPKRSIYYYNLSQSYLTMGKRKKSNYAFQRAVSIIPTSTQDYTDLAEIFFDRGMASYAIQVLKEGITRLHNSDYLYLVLADFYERTGANKSAKEILEEYLTNTTEENTFTLLIRRKLNQLEGL